MTTRRTRAVLLGWALFAVGCGPGTAGTGETGSATDPTSTSTGSTGDVTSTGTDMPTGGTTDTPATDGASGSSGEVIECMDVPVTPGGPLTCDGEELALDDTCDQLAGYEVCANEAIHRHTSVACHLPDRDPCVRSDADSGCQTDSECAEQSGGICEQYDTSSCECKYFCEQDDECGAGNACICPTKWAEGHPDERGPVFAYKPCVPAQCRSDADCGGGQRCGVSPGVCRGVEALYCHTPADECEGDEDCEPPGNNRCAFDPAQMHWVCDVYYPCE